MSPPHELSRLGDEGAWCLEGELTCVEVSTLHFYHFFHFKVVFLFKNRTKYWGNKKEGLAMAEDKLGGPPKQCHDVSHGTFENVFNLNFSTAL